MMPFATNLTVPTAHLSELTRRLTQAGFTVLDTGERISTDAGVDAEASIHLVQLAVEAQATPIELGIRR